MKNFLIGYQIDKELEEFRTSKIRLASTQQNNQEVRFAKVQPEGYYFNQMDTVALIDLYYNSKFESGPKDPAGQRKIFMNVGKFRSDVATKQIDIDVKDGRFIPDTYADPWTAIFLQKEFKEWAKEKSFGAEINKYAEAFPKYGTIVGKKVGKEIKFVPLQNLRNEQTAESLGTAKFIIEEHPDMTPWEMQEMPNWNTEGLVLRFDQTMMVYERYGYVPLKWLKESNDETANDGDELIYVDALVICGKPPANTKLNEPWHIFFAAQIKTRPYREAHYAKQHGRWLGLGVMEDLVENQEAKNIIVNLILKGLRWSSKVIGQSRDTNVVTKNLVSEVPDGAILEVGPEGNISILDLTPRSQGQFQQFLNEWEKNSDQKAFTYEVATGESLPGGTPFRLGVLLGDAVNSFYDGKRERLGLFLEAIVQDFLVPEFMRDMQNGDKVLAMFSNEAGFEILQEAAKNLVRSEVIRLALLSGKPVDPNAIDQAVSPFEEVKMLFFNRDAKYYSDMSFKYTFQFTGEAESIKDKLTSLQSIYQLLIQNGDPRAEKVLERMSALSGESMAQFGQKALPAAAAVPGASPATKVMTANAPAAAVAVNG